MIDEKFDKISETQKDNDNQLNKITKSKEEDYKRINKMIEEDRKQTKENYRQWGYLAKKMGTIDEDLISPATRPIIKKYFGGEVIFEGIRILKRDSSKTFEVDVLAVCEKQVFMIEVKSTPKSEYVEEILEKAKIFKEFFPEYEDKEVIPIFAGIEFSDNIVKRATRKGLYVMAYKEWKYMDIINFNQRHCKK